MSTLKLNNTFITFTPPQPLSALLEREGISHPHPCGGRGVCGKCAVDIEGELSPLTDAEVKAGTRLSCQTVLLGDATLTLRKEGKLHIETNQPPHLSSNIYTGGQTPCVNSTQGVRPLVLENAALSAAIDIGTTTVVVQVYDSKGTLYGTAAELNPQTAVAADVMGRINAALNGKGALLQRQILSALERLLRQAAGDHFDSLERMVITGNTTMLYLLTGRDTKSLATAPFEADHLFDEESTVLGIPTYFPPCISAFVGADITCALLHSGICDTPQTALLCDIGTNGELALWHNGKLTVTSTAAGPVFEGAGIRQGMLGQSGAIDSVTVENGKLNCHTIDDLTACGICGSGLIDAVAAGLDLELIDETGFLEEDPLPLRDGISLYGQDVRNLQLAKSAIASGIGALLHQAGLTPEEIKRCVIAGGFGKHLNIESAVRIGLLPRAWQTEYQGSTAPSSNNDSEAPTGSDRQRRLAVIGNAALAGAAELLLHPERIEYARALIRNAVHMELGGDATFNEMYIENMMFE